MGQRVRKLTPYSLEAVLNQQVIAYIMSQTFKLQVDVLSTTWGVAHTIKARTGHATTQTLISRMMRGGQPSRDTRKRSDVIVVVNQDFIEDFVAAFSTPGQVTRVYHGKSYDCEIVDVPYSRRDFTRISLGDVDWRNTPAIETLIPEEYSDEFNDHVAAKQGCLTNNFVAEMAKFGVSRNELVESAIARAYELRLPHAQDTLTRLSLERQFRDAHPLKQEIPKDMFSLTVYGILDDADVTIDQFSKLAKVNNLTDLLHNREPITPGALQKIGKAIHAISPKWTIDDLKALADKRSEVGSGEEAIN